MQLLAEIGVVFLVFTLGLEFSLARMVAMKARGARRRRPADAAHDRGVRRRRPGRSASSPAVAIVLGGALAMSSTAIVRAPARRAARDQPHALARWRSACCCSRTSRSRRCSRWRRRSAPRATCSSPAWLLGMVGRAIVALLLVLVLGRWLFRPLFREIARHRSTETFTLTVLFVALSSALGDARARAVDGAGRVPRRHAAVGDRVPPPDRGRDQAVPGHPARPVLRLGRHAARPAAAARAAAAGAAAARRAAGGQGS